jgi:hypothetical protein
MNEIHLDLTQHDPALAAVVNELREELHKSDEVRRQQVLALAATLDHIRGDLLRAIEDLRDELKP